MFQIILWVVLGICGGMILARKGYPPAIGVLFGVLLGPLGLIIAAIMPKTAGGKQMAVTDEMSVTRETRACPNCGRENAVTSRFCARCDHRYV